MEERRKSIENKLNLSLKNIGIPYADESNASERNCENMIGIAQIPMGIAGPLKVNSKKIFIPLATTEGALVASVNRGCKAITESGGGKVIVKKTGTTRGPVFKTKDINESIKFEKWLITNLAILNKIAESTSDHIKLLKIEPKTVGNYVFVRFTFDTDKAMGMNMATIATDKIAEYIWKKLKIECLAVSGNFCVDKKASWQNFISGRGYEISAEVLLSKKIIKNVLKTDAKKFFDVWLSKCMVGSAITGSVGFNAQYANIIAAVFLATGQDIAHVVEGSIGITTAEVTGENLKVGIYLPDVMAGTVGGGTGLATQKEALSIIGKDNFFEGIGGAVLAGEISLLASLSEKSLARAHKNLARGK